MEGKDIIYGGIEAGGTHFVLSVAKNDVQNIIEEKSYETTSPEETLNIVIDWFKSRKIHSLGIASFGPLDLNKDSNTYGNITSTPKPNWGNTPIYKKMVTELGLSKVNIQTDVNASAIGEALYGNHSSNAHIVCYITVGTGVGIGVSVNGMALPSLLHTEGGHIKLRKLPNDQFEGTCPFHTDCIEGLCNAPSLAKRANVKQSELKNLPDDHFVWNIWSDYLGQVCAILTLVISPHVIVLGGGVCQRTSVIPKVREVCLRNLGNYIQHDVILNHIDKYIVSSRFKDRAGVIGSLALSREAYENK